MTERTKPPRVFLSELTGKAYAVTDYPDRPDGVVVRWKRHDVTDDVVHDLMAAAWYRGWANRDAAAEGAPPRNPYMKDPT